MTIYNRHDFQAFSSFRRADVRATALRHCKGRVDKALFFVQHATRAKFAGDVSQDSAQNLALTPSLKPAMHRFVIRITLRQHVPLRPGVQNPQRRFKDFPRRNRLPTRAPLRNVLFRENDAGYAPNPNRAAESSNTYSPSATTRNFEIGSRL